MFLISKDYLCFKPLLFIASHSSFMEEIFSLRILFSGFLLTVQSVSTSVVFLFILDSLVLDASSQSQLSTHVLKKMKKGLIGSFKLGDGAY